MVGCPRSTVSRCRQATASLLTSATVPDLTFHEMAFLKQPRREPQQPVSRRRELEKKREDREREEISAFFLHKSLPDRYDTQGRKQPDISGLSSHDGKTGNRSSQSHDRRHIVDKDRLPPQTNDHATQVVDQGPLRTREESRASTYISWSSSHPSPCVRAQSLSETRGLSSTPVRVRDALARTGIFDSTGIQFAANFGHERPQPEVFTHNNVIGARPIPTTELPEQDAQQATVPPVRIVRYHDRGTMAGDEFMDLRSPEAHAKGAATQTEPDSARAKPWDTTVVQQTGNKVEARTAYEASVGLTDMTDLNKTDSHRTRPAETAVRQNGGSPRLEVGPARPQAPKRAIVERLEALAEDAKSQTSPAASSTTALMNHQPTRTAHDLGPLNADLGPAIPINDLQTTVPDANRFVTSPVYRAIQANLAPLDPSSSSHPTYPQLTPFRVLTLHNMPQTQYAPTAAHITHGKGELAYNPRPELKPVQGIVHGEAQSMQDYIAEIERHAWDGSEQGENHKTSPLREAHISRHSSRSDLNGNDGNDSAHFRSGTGSMCLPVDRADISYQDRGLDADWEEEEEQRFMSSFWSPNGYLR